MKNAIRRYAVVPTLLLAAGLTLTLGGCAKGSMEDKAEGSAAQNRGAEIRLGACSTTRSVNTLGELSAVGDNVGIYGVSTSLETPGLPADGQQWGMTPVMENVRTTGIDASGVISWEGTYYYPEQGASYVAFCAYHPYGVLGAVGQPFYLEAPSTGQAPRLRFTLSGTEDLMCADPVFGRHDVKPSALEFRHLLTQLRFELVDESGFMSGESLQSIVLTGVNRSGAMDIASGELSEWGTLGEISVPGISETPITGTSAAPQPVGGEVMLQPGQEFFSMRVVTSQDTFPNVRIYPSSSIDGVAETSFSGGRSYLITLTFRKSSVESTATVSPWVIAGTGDVSFQ